LWRRWRNRWALRRRCCRWPRRRSGRWVDCKSIWDYFHGLDVHILSKVHHDPRCFTGCAHAQSICSAVGANLDDGRVALRCNVLVRLDNRFQRTSLPCIHRQTDFAGTDAYLLVHFWRETPVEKYARRREEVHPIASKRGQWWWRWRWGCVGGSKQTIPERRERCAPGSEELVTLHVLVVVESRNAGLCEREPVARGGANWEIVEKRCRRWARRARWFGWW